MFATQFAMWPRSKGEDTGTETPVVAVHIRGNAEKLAQMMLAGQYVEAARLGYEFGPEDKIPDEILTRPGKKADITDVLDYVEQFGKRIRAQVRNMQKEQNDAAGGVRDEDETSGKTKTAEAQPRISAPAPSGADGGTEK